MAQIGTIKLVTNLVGTIEFLENLGKLHRAFSVHHKHQQHKNCTLKEAQQMVKTVCSYCNATVEKVKSSNGITSTNNGPQLGNHCREYSCIPQFVGKWSREVR